MKFTRPSAFYLGASLSKCELVIGRMLLPKYLLPVVSILLSIPVLASESTSDTAARFLAGMSLKGTHLEKYGDDSQWTEHATDFDRGWARFETEQLSKIRSWAPNALGRAYEDTSPMIYMFSGPDFLYANAFFPHARTYVLCGIEPIGMVPDVDKIPTAELSSALASLRKSLSSLLDESYFVTKYMMSDLKQPQLTGVLPILLVFLARAHNKIDSVTSVALDRDGKFVNPGEETIPGVKIILSGPSGQRQTLYYFKTDLSDRSIGMNPGFMRFCQGQGRENSLLKAACYYMKSKNFSIVRSFLLNHSKIIIEDDSGIPFDYFDPNKWSVQLYGKPDDETKPDHLEFGFGYGWKITHTTLMVATPK